MAYELFERQAGIQRGRIKDVVVFLVAILLPTKWYAILLSMKWHEQMNFKSVSGGVTEQSLVSHGT
ncbi:hypothetical protein F511_39102 [Dorcoceras hygrometricum]|uniref:Uncharacterized protein n=1 Tax=Dorcoceras hygrometricum TaxID=472368 RepID=A0A2Z7AJQ4_9LAMI|nr:hypothetical protein F511_39102 [Dorcoceras hygrometricum]